MATDSKEKQEDKESKPVRTTSTAAWLLPVSLLVFVLSFAVTYYLSTTSLSSTKPVGVVDGAGELSEIYPRALLDKYKSEMVKVEPRHLVSDLTCDDAAYTAATMFDGKVFPVTEPMETEQPMADDRVFPVTEPMETEQPMADDRVFFMLNGANDGVYVSWNSQFECVGQAAEVAAAWLGADRDVMVNGVRLYSQMGWPVRNAKELRETKNIVHVLLDFQLWQWPGIKKGYKYVLEDGVTLTTVGMSPKVLDVKYFLTQEEADK
ncbi:hypothetical protein PHYPSEUDO_013782, partial [Phytophthora pseudosyringae]